MNDRQSNQPKMSTEELARTQVLNLDDLREVAKYEKKTSKRPAIFCAIFGAILLTLGAGVQGYITHQNKVKLEAIQKNVVKRKNPTITEQKPKVPATSTLKCTLSSQGNANGTNYVSEFTFEFANQKLKKETKVFMLDKIVGNKIGESAMNNLYVAYRNFEKINGTVNGYSITSAPRGDVGFTITTLIDLTLLNASSIPAEYNANAQIRVDFPLDSDYETVKTSATASGFICE